MTVTKNGSESNGSGLHASFCTVPEAIEDFRMGRMVLIVDDEDRENEGDIAVAAQFATPEAINFMAAHGRGSLRDHDPGPGTTADWRAVARRTPRACPDCT